MTNYEKHAAKFLNSVYFQDMQQTDVELNLYTDAIGLLACLDCSSRWIFSGRCDAAIETEEGGSVEVQYRVFFILFYFF